LPRIMVTDDEGTLLWLEELGDDFDPAKPGHWSGFTEDLRHEMTLAMKREREAWEQAQATEGEDEMLTPSTGQKTSHDGYNICTICEAPVRPEWTETRHEGTQSIGFYGEMSDVAVTDVTGRVNHITCVHIKDLEGHAR